MKKHLAFILIYSVCTLAAVAQPADKVATATQTELVRVHTALDHITVIEFGEPVTMAAAGSAAFRIERQEDKVLIEPLKSGAATNLLVWTASRRFTYELEPAGEVAKMSVAIDNSISRPKPAVTSEGQTQGVTDMVLAKAFLGAEQIQSNGIETPRDGVLVRVQQVFRARDTVYIHYSIENRSQSRYHTSTPTVYDVQAEHPSIAVISLALTQLNRAAIAKLGQTTQQAIAITFAENDGVDVDPGLTRQGVVAIHDDTHSVRILQLQLDPAVRATLVF